MIEMNYRDIDKLLYTTQLPKGRIIKHVGSSHYILIPKFVVDETFLNADDNKSVKITMLLSNEKLKIELEMVEENGKL